MENLYIMPTRSTPEIDFNAERNTLKIAGQSYPENALRFYEPIMGWIDSYLNGLEGKTVLEVNLTYLNTSSSKCMLDIIDMLEAAYTKGKDVSLNWYYDVENENILECAEEFREDINFPFNIISIDENA